MRITSTQLRQIIREEASLLLREAKSTKAKVKRAAPPAPTAYTGDTLLVFVTDDGYIEYFVGSEDAVGAFVESGGRDEPKALGLEKVKKIGTERDWDNLNNGGPHPVAKWLKKNSGITKILDQDNPDPEGSTEFWNVADWLADHTESEYED